MRKLLLASCIVAAGFAPLVATAASEMQASINVAAQMLAEAGNLEQKQWANHAADLAAIWAASESSTNSCAAGRTCASITIANLTGVITFTFGTPEALNKNLRGGTIVLTPQFLNDAGSWAGYTARNEATTTAGSAVQSSKKIGQYLCVMTLVAGSKNPMIYTPPAGRTINFLEKSTVGPIGVEATLPTNLLKIWCKASDVVTS